MMSTRPSASSGMSTGVTSGGEAGGAAAMALPPARPHRAASDRGAWWSPSTRRAPAQADRPPATRARRAPSPLPRRAAQRPRSSRRLGPAVPRARIRRRPGRIRASAEGSSERCERLSHLRFRSRLPDRVGRLLLLLALRLGVRSLDGGGGRLLACGFRDGRGGWRRHRGFPGRLGRLLRPHRLGGGRILLGGHLAGLGERLLDRGLLDGAGRHPVRRLRGRCAVLGGLPPVISTGVDRSPASASSTGGNPVPAASPSGASVPARPTSIEPPSLRADWAVEAAERRARGSPAPGRGRPGRRRTPARRR